jgi:hypothetical protein
LQAGTPVLLSKAEMRRVLEKFESYGQPALDVAPAAVRAAVAARGPERRRRR